MTNIIQYLYYRIAHALLNLNQWEKDYYDVHAMTYLSLCIVSNIALITMLSKYLVAIVIICMIVIWRIWPDDKTYELLDQKYKGEKHRVIKGWLVFIYCILSFFSFIAVIIIFA